MCVLHGSLGSKVRLRTYGCVVMGSAVLFLNFMYIWLDVFLDCRRDSVCGYVGDVIYVGQDLNMCSRWW